MSKKTKKYIIAVDIGATYLRVAAGDEKGNLNSVVKEKTAIKGDKTTIAKQIIRIINSIEKPKNISAISIAAAGRIDPADMKVYATDHPLKIFDLKDILKEFKIPVHIINDCNAAVLGINKFAKNSYKNLVYVTISTGIGAGAIDDNHLVLGKDGNAMEAGHIVVDYKGGLECACGGMGHWESYASGKNIPKFLKSRTGIKENISPEDIFYRAKNGDEDMLKFIDELGKINAAGLASLINVFNPEAIFLGGSVVINNKNLILEPIEKYLKNYSYNPIPDIKISPLGDETVLYGAVANILYNKK